MTIQGLTKRLEAVFHIVPIASVIADIGTDHGYLAVALVEGEKANRVIAGDVNEGPLRSAKKYIVEKGLEELIDCRLGSGLEVLLPHEADVVICCGMGGFLMIDLIKEAPYLPPVLVLQPQSGVEALRKYVYELGYRPSKEMIVEDMGHIYEANTWIKDSSIPSPYDMLEQNSLLWEMGAMLYTEKHPLLQQKLSHLLAVEQDILQKLEQGTSLQALAAKDKAIGKIEALASLLDGWEIANESGND